ncbi:MAG: hypothetical protein ABI120_16485, partial [Gemmatimonadaceae bacterium]
MFRHIMKAVRKLRGRSSHELFTRASQEFYAWSDRAALRLGTSTTLVPSNADRAFTQPFFPGISHAPQTTSALRTVAPLDQEEVLQRAGKIERGHIPLLGYGDVYIGQSPNWQRDPFSGMV